MSLHCIVWCCMVLYCWLWRAGCISQDTYLLYCYRYQIRALIFCVPLHSIFFSLSIQSFFSIPLHNALSTLPNQSFNIWLKLLVFFCTKMYSMVIWHSCGADPLLKFSSVSFEARLESFMFCSSFQVLSSSATCECCQQSKCCQWHVDTCL